MALQLANTEDKHTRYNGSVCIYGGVPCYINSNTTFQGRYLNSSNGVWAKPLIDKKDYPGADPFVGMTPNGTFYEVNYTSDLFVDRDFEIGYVNLPQGSRFFNRGFFRSFTQGLHFNNTVDIGGTTQFSTSAALGLCLINKYPTYAEALDSVSNGVSMAFDRQFSVGNLSSATHCLEFRGMVIGHKKKNRPQWSVFNMKMNRVICPLIQSHGLIFKVEE